MIKETISPKIPESAEPVAAPAQVTDAELRAACTVAHLHHHVYPEDYRAAINHVLALRAALQTKPSPKANKE